VSSQPRAVDGREDEINDNLDLVMQGVQRIKLQAELAGSQLDSNMEKEKHITGRMSAEQTRIVAAEQRAARLAGIPSASHTKVQTFKMTQV
jgi:hypothetical protein